MRIDLHAHSTASDGTDTPAELVAAAAAANLDAIALTDHDTTAGWADAVAALPAGLRLIRGAEFSCVVPTGPGAQNGRAGQDDPDGRVSVHLLGYLFDPASAAITTEQARLREERRRRLRGMAELMAADGFPVDPDAVLATLPLDAPAGRPHLARALVSAGVVPSIGEAFDRYLAAGSRYYLTRADTAVGTAIRMIHAAGGVPVLAHPLARHRGPVLSVEAIVDLAADGLAGIEVDHPDHAADDRATLRDLAAGLNLVVTGSSDYHGGNKANWLGQETTDPQVLEQIEEWAAGSRVAAVTG